jgi:hypothetical protein
MVNYVFKEANSGLEKQLLVSGVDFDMGVEVRFHFDFTLAIRRECFKQLVKSFELRKTPKKLFSNGNLLLKNPVFRFCSGQTNASCLSYQCQHQSGSSGEKLHDFRSSFQSMKLGLPCS